MAFLPYPSSLYIRLLKCQIDSVGLSSFLGEGVPDTLFDRSVQCDTAVNVFKVLKVL